MKMPYGKFKHQEIHTLPSWYLKWIAENFDEKTETQKKIIKEADQEWQYREKYNSHI
jgi:uncharacterized protein (DUF3820 family)